MRRFTMSAAARALVAMAAVMVLGGCATKSDIRDLQSELRALAARQDSLMADLRGEMLNAQDTIRGQSAQLFDFRGEIFRQLREISEGIDRVEALAGSNQMAVAGIRDQLANLRRMPAQTTGGGAEGGGDPGVTPQMGGDAEEIYGAALAQFQRGSLTTARAAFESLLDGYPTHARAPDAHYYLGEILTQEDRPEEALDAFLEIPELFPTAPRVPDALYRAGVLQLELGQTEAAIDTLERVVNTYPGTTAAMTAADKLREIR